MLVPFIKRSSLYKKTVSTMRDRLCGPVKDLEHVLFQYAKGVQTVQNLNFESLKKSVLSFLEKRRIGTEPWEYGFSASAPYSSLYTTTYVVMLRSMFLGPGAGYSAAEINKLKEYFLHFQDPETGYFIDPTLEDGEYISTVNGNNQWWGYGHLLCQILPCLTIVGATPRYPFSFLKKMHHEDEQNKFLTELDYGAGIDYTGNIIMNYGVALQYDAIVGKNPRSMYGLERLLDFLYKTANPAGVWGNIDDTPHNKSKKIQAAFHFWPLFFFSKRLPPLPDGLTDFVISTQNYLGGYGVEVACSSACEDIDSIEPLRRFYDFVDVHSQERIKASVKKALPWVLANQNEDGGFVFTLNGKLHYGHDRLSSLKNESAMFPTWFRVLSIAHALRVVEKNRQFYFCNCPGFLF